MPWVLFYAKEDNPNLNNQEQQCVMGGRVEIMSSIRTRSSIIYYMNYTKMHIIQKYEVKTKVSMNSPT